MPTKKNLLYNRIKKEIREEVWSFKDIGNSSLILPKEIEKFVEWLNLGAEKKILDICCGNGSVLTYIVTKSNCKGYGIDVNTQRIDSANILAEHNQIDIKFLNFNLTNSLPFQDSFFDSIICLESIFYFDATSRFKLFKEWKRVLKPNGKLIFTDSCIIAGLIAKREIEHRSIYSKFIGEYFFLPLFIQESIIKKAGLNLVSAEDITAKNASIIAKKLRVARTKRVNDLKIIETKEEFEYEQMFVNVCDHLYNRQKSLVQYAYYITKM